MGAKWHATRRPPGLEQARRLQEYLSNPHGMRVLRYGYRRARDSPLRQKKPCYNALGFDNGGKLGRNSEGFQRARL